MSSPTNQLEYLPLGFRQCKVGMIPADKLIALLKAAVRDLVDGEVIAESALSHSTKVAHALVCEHSPGVTEQEVQVWNSLALSGLALTEFERQMRLLMPVDVLGQA